MEKLIVSGLLLITGGLLIVQSARYLGAAERAEQAEMCWESAYLGWRSNNELINGTGGQAAVVDAQNAELEYTAECTGTREPNDPRLLRSYE